MAARGRQFARPAVSRDRYFLGYTTCKISKAGIGGPLIDFDGKFVGMNFYDDKVSGTPYVMWSEILPVLEYFMTKGNVAGAGDDGNQPCVLDWTSNSWPVPAPYWCHPDDLVQHEYEMPSWYLGSRKASPYVKFNQKLAALYLNEATFAVRVEAIDVLFYSVGLLSPYLN